MSESVVNQTLASAESTGYTPKPRDPIKLLEELDAYLSFVTGRNGKG